MQSRRIVVGAVLLATLFVLGISSAVFSCVPDDAGRCDGAPAHLRLSWLGGGGGKANATIILADNQDNLKESLLQFANVKGKAGWGATDEIIGAETTKPTAPRILTSMSLFKWTDMDLERALNKIYELSPDESMNRAHRIALILSEQQRRLDLRALEAQAALAARQPKPAVAAPTAQPAAAAVQGSSDPYNAPAPNGAWAYIEPHSTLWYRVDDGWRRLNVWMNDNHAQGLSLAIYGPDQTDVWGSKPAGMGTPGNNFDFWWTGRSAIKGFWTLRLTNNTDKSMPYSLNGHSFSETAGDMCRDCHGNIQDDQFEKCHHTGSWCNDLKDEYKGKAKGK